MALIFEATRVRTLTGNRNARNFGNQKRDTLNASPST